MSPRQRLSAVFLAVAVLATACGGSDASDDVATGTTDATAPAADAPAESAEAGEAAPSLLLPTVAGGQLDFADLQGQDTVLWFWAPW